MIKKLALWVLREEMAEITYLEKQLRLEIQVQKDLVARIKASNKASNKE